MQGLQKTEGWELGEGGGVVEVEEVGVEVGRDVVEGWASGVDVAPVLDALSAIAPME